MKTLDGHKSVATVYSFLIKRENWIAGLFIAVSMIQVWLTRYVPSLDGPQHLYNANVIVQLLKGNELFKEFYKFNEVIVGYWSGHFLLSFFKVFFPAWLAEKFFLSAYVFGMFFSFRYLVRGVFPKKENLMIYLIFPFIFHNYQVLGYYSFSIAVIFYYWGFGYWIRNRNHFQWKEMAVFGAIALGVFLSHGLVFLFFGVTFLVYFLFVNLSIVVRKEEAIPLKVFFSRMSRLAISVLPAVVLWAIYIRSVMKINATVISTSYSKTELLEFIFRIRQLVGFEHEMESLGYRMLFYWIALLSIISFVLYIWKRANEKGHWIELFNESYTWITISFLYILTYFMMPDRISAGSLTNRYGLFFFLTLIVFLATQKTPKWLQMLGLILVMGVLVNARIIQQEFLKKLNVDVLEIKEMAEHMEDGSIIYSINTSNNWIHRHFQLYAADNKELIHLKNPQCAGQFPVKWDLRSLPECYIGEKLVYADGAPDISGQGHRKVNVDYVTVFYHKPFLESDDYSEWRDLLEEEYDLVMVTSARELGALYRRKNFSSRKE